MRSVEASATRFGIEILKTMILYKLHKKHIYSHRIFRRAPTAPANPAISQAR